MLGLFRKKEAKKFGQIAVEKGLATKEDIAEALRIQEEYTRNHKIHKEIGTILIEKGILTLNDVKIILENQKNEIKRFAWFSALFHLSR